MSEDKIILAKSASNNFKDLFSIDNFKFRKVNESISGNFVWRCTMKLCLARLIKNGYETVSSNLNHNHYTDEKKLNHQIMRSACKKRAKDMTDRPIKIIRSEITKYSFDTLDYRMYPCRNIQTNISKNIVEVQEFLVSKNMLFSKGKSMIAVNDIKKKYCNFYVCQTSAVFKFS